MAKVHGPMCAAWLVNKTRSKMVGGVLSYDQPIGQPVPSWFTVAMAHLSTRRGWTVTKSVKGTVLNYKVRWTKRVTQ